MANLQLYEEKLLTARSFHNSSCDFLSKVHFTFADILGEQLNKSFSLIIKRLQIVIQYVLLEAQVYYPTITLPHRHWNI